MSDCGPKANHERRIHQHLNPLHWSAEVTCPAGLGRRVRRAGEGRGSPHESARGYHAKRLPVQSLERMIPEERIPPPLIADSGGRAVARIDNGFIGQNHKFLPDALHKTFMAHSLKVAPADSEIKQGIAAEDHPMP